MHLSENEFIDRVGGKERAEKEREKRESTINVISGAFHSALCLAVSSLAEN